MHFIPSEIRNIFKLMKYLILKKYLNPPISLEKEGAKPSPQQTLYYQSRVTATHPPIHILSTKRRASNVALSPQMPPDTLASICALPKKHLGA
jgi:hypothetical protein